MERTERYTAFCRRFGLQVPILLAPMAGVPAPELSVAVANAGGMGSCGALLMKPNDIRSWQEQFHATSNGASLINLWVPDPAPRRDAAHEARLRDFLGGFGPAVAPDAGDAPLLDFAAQCDALIAARPAAASSIMGLFPDDVVTRLKEAGIAWFATVTTVAEARAAEAAGADVLVAQGSEAGGHRGAFDAALAERQAVGLMALLPAVVDAVSVPVVAAGGIGDGRGVAAALALGASAVQIGSALLRTPEAKINPAWADALAATPPEGTVVSRAFSGRAGRSIATEYALAALAPEAPQPAPYPVQRGLTAAMRDAAGRSGDVQRMQAWAGQSSALGRAEPAGEAVSRIWREACRILSLPAPTD